MKLSYYLFVLIISFSCQTDKKRINVREYIYPSVGSENNKLYEYEGANKEVYNLKYLLIERYGSLSNTYQYTFLDDELTMLSGYVEIRGDRSIELQKMLVSDVNEDNEQIIQEINFEGMELPIELELNKSFEIPVEWESKSQSNIKYNHLSSRKLIDVNTSLDHIGYKVKIIKIQSNEKFEIINSLDVYKNVSQFIMTTEYGEGIGLLNFEIRFENGLTSKAKLNSIHKLTEMELTKVKTKDKDFAKHLSKR